MPIELQCDDFVLTQAEVGQLWAETILHRNFTDDDVAVRCVGEEEIKRLNTQYRNQDKPTNVLTFSYDEDELDGPQAEDAGHDVALCMAVAKREAADRKVQLRDYTALLLVHAFLHVTGMDHERSDQEETATEEAERLILAKVGFAADSLLHLQ